MMTSSSAPEFALDIAMLKGTSTALVAIDNHYPEDGEKIADFTASLEQALKDLAAARQQSSGAVSNAKTLAEGLDKRGWFGQLLATFSSETDKDLATQVGAIAASLSTTQSVLDVILKIETQENRLLDSFNKAVVEKIEKIVSDTIVLRGDQKNSALAFLKIVRARINEHRQLQESVKSHAEQLDLIGAWQLDADRDMRRLSDRFAELYEDASGIRELLGQAQLQTEQVAERANTHAARIDDTKMAMARQMSRIEALEAANGRLSSELAAALGRTSQLETWVKSRQSLKGRAVRYAPAAAALGLAAFALIGR